MGLDRVGWSWMELDGVEEAGERGVGGVELLKRGVVGVWCVCVCVC